VITKPNWPSSNPEQKGATPQRSAIWPICMPPERAWRGIRSRQSNFFADRLIEVISFQSTHSAPPTLKVLESRRTSNKRLPYTGGLPKVDSRMLS